MNDKKTTSTTNMAPKLGEGGDKKSTGLSLKRKGTTTGPCLVGSSIRTAKKNGANSGAHRTTTGAASKLLCSRRSTTTAGRTRPSTAAVLRKKPLKKEVVGGSGASRLLSGIAAPSCRTKPIRPSLLLVKKGGSSQTTLLFSGTDRGTSLLERRAAPKPAFLRQDLRKTIFFGARVAPSGRGGLPALLLHNSQKAIDGEEKEEGRELEDPQKRPRNSDTMEDVVADGAMEDVQAGAGATLLTGLIRRSNNNNSTSLGSSSSRRRVSDIGTAEFGVSGGRVRASLSKDEDGSSNVKADLSVVVPPRVSSPPTSPVPRASRRSRASGVFSPVTQRAVASYSYIVLPEFRTLLRSKRREPCLRYDSASYGQDWVVHQRGRELEFGPWQFCLSGKIEKLRLAVVACYWESMRIHPISPATVFVAVNNLGRLLSLWDSAAFERPSAMAWASTAVAAYRLAFKTEERPEVLWEVTNFWNLFPIFKDWELDRSDDAINKFELGALQQLRDLMDVPLAPMFLDLYLSAGGWPAGLVSEFHELALYLLALTTFATTKDYLLKNVTPSRLAAAALVLAIKIVNTDRATADGMLRHLTECEVVPMIRGGAGGRLQKSGRAWSQQQAVATDNTSKKSNTQPVVPLSLKETCSCRYEFFPKRLQTYCAMTLEELQPVVRGLSSLLRTKQNESSVLKNFFPFWGENEWQ